MSKEMVTEERYNTLKKFLTAITVDGKEIMHPSTYLKQFNVSPATISRIKSTTDFADYKNQVRTKWNGSKKEGQPPKNGYEILLIISDQLAELIRLIQPKEEPRYER